MAVLCPAGDAQIDFVYRPAGIRPAKAVTLAALPVFLVYALVPRRKKRRQF